MKSCLRFVAVACLIGLAATPSGAVDLGENISLHGFGTWAYGKTDGNLYLTGSEEGDYGNTDFYLNIQAQPSEKLSISAQVGWVNDYFGTNVDFDYAFAEYSFSDAAKLRMGRVKHPFGIYGEIQRVGVLRPFLTLPQTIYGTFGFIGAGYDGIGLTGQTYSENGWGLRYDIYGGELRTDLEISNLLLFPIFQDPAFLNDEVARYEGAVTDMLGFRFDISTPVNGLRFGTSAYTGTEAESQIFTQGSDRTILGAHVEYGADGIMLRAEYLDFEQKDNTVDPVDLVSSNYYVEASYRFANNWQIAARYDEMDLQLVGLENLPLTLQEAFRHEEVSFGLNYWLSSHFVIKASLHKVSGLRFASIETDAPLDVIFGNQFDKNTDLIQFGGQFSF